MKLVWKLLKQNMSIPQFVGFFFASLFGMFIVLFGYQFYRDVLPFTKIKRKKRKNIKNQRKKKKKKKEEEKK